MSRMADSLVRFLEMIFIIFHNYSRDPVTYVFITNVNGKLRLETHRFYVVVALVRKLYSKLITQLITI